jgi:glycerol uptake facilitator-like aquaporin
MQAPSLHKRLAAEFVGSTLLLATVVGSGIMGERLAGGNIALALLGNTIPTGAILVVLILIFGPVSGAHFNPVVSAAFALNGKLSTRDLMAYILVQIMGAVVGVWVAHGMFDLPILQMSGTIRTGASQWLAEGVATFGLLLTIFGCVARAPAAVPYAVGLYITAAYWFTASTSFANPSVTIARSLTDTFAGIAPANSAAFILAQCIGAGAGYIFSIWLWSDKVKPNTGPVS